MHSDLKPHGPNPQGFVDSRELMVSCSQKFDEQHKVKKLTLVEGESGEQLG